MTTYSKQIESLNCQQREAVEISCNAVVAAGAGAGKTKVLASRFLHLVVERKIPVDEILALTFTRKAAAEMRSRIYSMLAETESPAAQEAAASFYSAQIETIDSFCASICRTACRAWGVSPDFAIDDDALTQRAKQAALAFILEHRASPALKSMLKKFTLEELASKLFVAAMKDHSSISSPLDFKKILAAQKEAVKKKFAATVSNLQSDADTLREMAAIQRQSGKGGKTWEKLNAALSAASLSSPDIADRASVVQFTKECSAIAEVENRLGDTDAKAALSDFRKETVTLVSLSNFILNEEIIDETFLLLDEFQGIFNEIKRAEGILTFRDLSQMASDALQRDEALRKFCKASFKSIMIDEFQDNNELQKDLLYLISGDCEPGRIPQACELEENKLFFVGDEKQSIYLFRGADVSVFRRLKAELGGKQSMPQLLVNYRTEKRLIDIFNRIFPHVFLPVYGDEGYKDYEAEYSVSEADPDAVPAEGCEPGLEILLLDDKRFDKKRKDIASKIDSEAAEVAFQIKQLVIGGYKIRDKAATAGEGATRPCEYADIAILFRSTGKQRHFEQKLREEGIPYQSESLAGLFSDAPANDLYSFLRLAANPEDTFSYAVVLRSPFVAVDDEGFLRIMAARAEAASKGLPPALPFSNADAALVPERSANKFKRAADAYSFIRENADKLPIANIVSALWYKFGYRYAVISDSRLIHYSEIYDYFFELARQADKKSLSLSDFLDSIEEKRKEGERFDEIDIPAGKGGGVRLMTVHKSKGLEFPVVFIVDAANSGKSESNAEPFYFSDEYSITINTQSPKELKDIKENKKGADNFFYMEAKEENAAKAVAETRRLLYVAMTRAEAKVFVSGSVTLSGKNAEIPKEARSEEEIMELLKEKLTKEKKEGKDNAVSSRISFLDLLLPALLKASDEAGGQIEGVSIKEVLPKPLQKKKRKAEISSADIISGVECTAYKAPESTRVAASELYTVKKGLTGKAGLDVGQLAALAEEDESEESLSAENSAFNLEGESEGLYPHAHAFGGESDYSIEGESAESDDAGNEIDITLKKYKISHEDFGTYVHAAIEEGFTGSPARIPQEIRGAAFKMAERFFASRLGKAAKAAPWRKTEYGFMMKTAHEGTGSLIISGKMDLVFEEGGTLFVVDYKTDKVENPAIYKEQMEAYKEAAKGLFASQFPEASVRGFLFYARSGHVVEIE